MTLLIDAHLDLAWNALSFDRDLTDSIDRINAREQHVTDSRSRGNATVSLAEMRRGEIAVCLGTLIAHARPDIVPSEGHQRISLEYRSAEAAYACAQGQLAYYRLLEQAGHLRLLSTAGDLTSHWNSWTSSASDANDEDLPIGLILAMEGADAIVTPSQVEEWFRLGLRSVNLVHYGHNQYAAGTGESGPLTSQGIELLGELERWGMILDVTHLSDAGFFQALDLFHGPVLASHNNCRSLVPGQRQFSDEQLQSLIQRGAVIGVAMDNWMLVSGWQSGISPRSQATLDNVADHIDHICQIAGDHRHVAIGSDLDGGYGTEQCPIGLGSIADLQKMDERLQQRGYTPEEVRDIFHRNWLQFFKRHLPDS
ncbi:MAG: dipeptidase [Aeoliella sp.]